MHDRSGRRSDLRVVLLQPGARHNYALARFLHRQGALQRLYTDFALSGDSIAGRLVGLAPLPGRAAMFRRRIAPGIPASLIRNSALGRRRIGSSTTDRPWSISDVEFREADIVYSQYSVGNGYADEIRAAGTRLVSDVFIMPSAHRIVNREVERFPEWGEAGFPPEEARFLDDVSGEMIRRSDFLFCPSLSVVEDVRRYDPAAAGKCRLVRYGSSLRFPATGATIEKRVLFAGAVQLRKGPQYLAAAAARIARIDPGVRFVFAGTASAAAARCLAGGNIELLGHLSRDAMREEFAKADLFVFPSLAEGSAGVVLEAMAAGLPIVATRAAGVDFADGLSGRIAPEADVDALVAAILEITGDRKLRQDMSHHARAESLAYDEDHWSDAFVGSLRELVQR